MFPRGDENTSQSMEKSENHSRQKNMLRVQEAYRGMGLGGLKEQEGTEIGD